MVCDDGAVDFVDDLHNSADTVVGKRHQLVSAGDRREAVQSVIRVRRSTRENSHDSLVLVDGLLHGPPLRGPSRSAYFGYDPATGHLTSITDVLGITSSFTYTPGTDFINTLTTPYGNTHFAFTDSTTTDKTDTSRSVTITDPLKRVSRVEFRQGALPCLNYFDPNYIVCVEPSAPPSTSLFSIYNYNLQYRNTFIWDPEQYATSYNNIATEACLPACAATRYTGAKIIHWLHTDNNPPNPSDTNPLTASRIPESIKEPLESRVWFNYPNQSLNGQALNAFPSSPSVAVGSTNQPSAIFRLLDDGTTQLWQYQYDQYGKLTQVTDPAGRQLTMTR